MQAGSSRPTGWSCGLSPRLLRGGKGMQGSIRQRWAHGWAQGRGKAGLWRALLCSGVGHKWSVSIGCYGTIPGAGAAENRGQIRVVLRRPSGLSWPPSPSRSSSGGHRFSALTLQPWGHRPDCLCCDWVLGTPLFWPEVWGLGVT